MINVQKCRNDNDEIIDEETKVCIDCNDEFVTYSGNEKCPECRKVNSSQSESIV